nr:hypothetical protein [Tanacetum cinerariifolium]
MAIFVIPISLDSSEESVGTSTACVILFGTIPTAIPATVPIVDPPVVHDDTPLIPTETPTIHLLFPPYQILPHFCTLIYLTVTLLRDHHQRTRISHRGTVEIGVDTVVETVVSEDTPVPTDDEDSREVVRFGLNEIVYELHDHLD